MRIVITDAPAGVLGYLPARIIRAVVGALERRAGRAFNLAAGPPLSRDDIATALGARRVHLPSWSKRPRPDAMGFTGESWDNSGDSGVAASRDGGAADGGPSLWLEAPCTGIWW